VTPAGATARIIGRMRTTCSIVGTPVEGEIRVGGGPGTPRPTGRPRGPLLGRRSPVATAVAAACVYEAAAGITNTTLGLDLLPSATAAVDRVTLARVRAGAVPPPWLRLTGALAAGLAVHLVHAALSRPRHRGTS
jgi:hypothetical protein